MRQIEWTLIVMFLQSQAVKFALLEFDYFDNMNLHKITDKQHPIGWEIGSACKIESLLHMFCNHLSGKIHVWCWPL